MKQLKKVLEDAMEDQSLQAMARLKAVMVLSTGIPVISALMLVEALMETLVNANNEEDPEFCEYIRTRLLNALVPKAVNHGKGD